MGQHGAARNDKVHAHHGRTGTHQPALYQRGTQITHQLISPGLSYISTAGTYLKTVCPYIRVFHHPHNDIERHGAFIITVHLRIATPIDTYFERIRSLWCWHVHWNINYVLFHPLKNQTWVGWQSIKCDT